MTRREKLENIIIGTLLESTEDTNYFDACKCIITADMFTNDMNRRIFTIISEMNAKGERDTRPSAIFDRYGVEVMELLSQMVDMVTDFSFIHLKMDYNERRYLASLTTGIEPEYTDVTFADYVEALVKIHYYEEGKDTAVRAAAAAA